MKNKPLSDYKKKKLIESFCDELTATQAAHRLNLDRNTVNKYFKRIRECIAGYREYKKMKLLIGVMSTPELKVETISKQIPSLNTEQGIPIQIMWLGGQLVTDIDHPLAESGSKFMINVSGYFNGCCNGYDARKSQDKDEGHDLHRIADDFHSFTTHRFKKFFGIKNEYAYLYVKEAEFVFNEKDSLQREKVLNKMAEKIFL